ncbi:MAG: hypothetical protein CMP20_09270 [Rickettsiales bacterium]|nr:hypothetical protein [Rickettsiales bacterium]
MGGSSSKIKKIETFHDYMKVMEDFDLETRERILRLNNSMTPSLDFIAQSLKSEEVLQLDHESVAMWLRAPLHSLISQKPRYLLKTMLYRHLAKFRDESDLKTLAQHAWYLDDENLSWWSQHSETKNKKYAKLFNDEIERRKQAQYNYDLEHALSCSLTELQEIELRWRHKNNGFTKMLKKWDNPSFVKRNLVKLDKKQLSQYYSKDWDMAFFCEWKRRPHSRTPESTLAEFESQPSWTNFLAVLTTGAIPDDAEEFIATCDILQTWKSVCPWWPRKAVKALVSVYPPSANEFAILLTLLYDLDESSESHTLLWMLVNYCKVNPCTAAITEHVARRRDCKEVMRILCRWKKPRMQT